MSRVEFSKGTKLSAWRRADGRCEQCGMLLLGKPAHYDHINPAAFSGEAGAALENCQVLCVGCHGAKTATRDIPAISKSNRIRIRAAGIRRERKITAWRNFAGEIIRKPRVRE